MNNPVSGRIIQEIAGDVQVGMASMQTYNPLATNAAWILLLLVLCETVKR